ncbi:MAG TPA: O-antigen ligase family protein, partial [Planctomycetota bacterium]|nr:O-antigen ligase family protein [Planctomycetota bacterium]
VVVLLQAAGIEHRFTPETDDVLLRELVGLMGNSTRAGALLALGVVAAFATATHGALSERASSTRLALAALILGTAALVLTRARGGWAGAGLGIAMIAAADARAVLARAKLWLPRVLLGAALAAVIAGGPEVFTARKLPGAAAPLSGGDLTTHVRLTVWRGTLDMIAQQPLLGFGLGSFRAEFPPFRDPAEAALPGLAGAPTEVDHPHDEFLLAAAEGGAAAGLALLAFAALTLAHGWRLARGPSPTLLARLAPATFAAGAVAACVQNAWMSPGTALPVFAAAGAVWGLRGWQRGDSAGAERPARRAATVAGLLAAVAALALLAVPRLEAQLGMRRFYLSADAEGVGADNLPLLVAAAEADPGDINAQRLLVAYGGQLIAAQPSAAREFSAPIAAARARVALLAPHVPPPPEAALPSVSPAPR